MNGTSLRALARLVAGVVRQWWPLALACALAVSALASGYTQSADQQLSLWRDGLQPHRASGRIVLIEIDAKSLGDVGRWPWPRRAHAALVDRLSAAGAETIAFDVDFSTRSTEKDDRALTAAFARAKGKIVLPTFRQASSTLAATEVENIPLAMFRDHAMLASVNVQPRANGELVDYGYGTVTGGVARPSLAAILAGSAGTVGESFRIDSAIDPGSIARLSAGAVLKGQFDPETVRGRTVMIGATAIEMGDRYVLPGHGIQPGVVAQLLATETLIAGQVNNGLGPVPPLFVVVIALIVLARSRRRFLLIDRAMLGATVLVLPLLGESAFNMSADIAPALLLIAIEAGVRKTSLFLRAINAERQTDLATGLPNARAFMRALAGEKQLVVVVARLLRFEAIEATLGDAGRATLAARMTDRLRLAFPDTIFYATAPGTIAFADVTVDASSLVARLVSAHELFRAPTDIAGQSIPLTPAFGICPGSGETTQVALAHAMLAARQSEASGRRWSIHSDAAKSAAQTELTLLADIDQAIESGDIFVVYQPKMQMSDGRIVGAEALVRWKHPTLGPVAPDSFIPLLENSGNVGRLTLAVLDAALAELTRWHESGAAMTVAVNISAVLLSEPGFIRTLHERLDAFGPMRRNLTLEITESAAVEHADIAATVLTDIKTKGVRVSIDDYGTGRATMTYLRSFAADEVKIDKSFITGIVDNLSDQILVRSTVDLARELNFAVVAEGVEDEACLAKLAEFGCDYAQGWAIGRPVPAEDFRQIFVRPERWQGVA
jgi:diguanylate cyclase